ncbi:MAG: aldehyde dehydrogenase family protein, partial [Lutimaribacter sp.]
MLTPQSYANGRWIGPGPQAQTIIGPVEGQPIAHAGGSDLDFAAMLDWAKTKGGPALRAMGFHQRAKLLKQLATYLDSRKDELYALNPLTGATRKDGWVDIEGGIGTMFLIASKGRREMPDGQVYIDGEVEQLGLKGGFLGQHIAVPLQGVAVHINAFNFPVWGMLEKLAPALLAGVPCIVKPATQTCYLTEHCFRMIIEADILPPGAVQLVVGRTGPLLGLLGAQDVVAFTGSADTAIALRQTPNLLQNSVRFASEQDSLNAAILGPDAGVDSPEFAQFIAEAHTEMTVKAGQKCTAMRRLIVPDHLADQVAQALGAKLAGTIIGDPGQSATQMGALASHGQRADVLEKLAQLQAEAQLVAGEPTAPVGLPGGAFLA